MFHTVYRFQSSHTSVKERNLYTEKIKKYNIKETKKWQKLKLFIGVVQEIQQQWLRA